MCYYCPIGLNVTLGSPQNPSWYNGQQCDASGKSHLHSTFLGGYIQSRPPHVDGFSTATAQVPEFLYPFVV